MFVVIWLFHFCLILLILLDLSKVAIQFFDRKKSVLEILLKDMDMWSLDGKLNLIALG